MSEFLGALTKGQVVFVGDRQLSSSEAAELLNMEEPCVQRLHAAGALLASGASSEGPRFPRSAVLEYKRKNREARLIALEELAEEGQQLNPRY
jgi:hypothetical protein